MRAAGHADLAGSRRAKVGFSTTALDRILGVDSLRALRPEVVEVCGFDAEGWADFAPALESLGVPIGLHCPLPYSGWMKHFEITGPHTGRQSDAFELVRATLECAKQYEARYVTVHFPTVLTPYNTEADRHLDPKAYLAGAVRSAQMLSDLSDKFDVPIFLENVGPNPYLYRGEHFVEVFERVTNLRMCLDFGHAHVLDLGQDVYDYTAAVAPYVAALHLYNASASAYRVGFHEPPLDDLSVAAGYMDLTRLLRSVAAAGTVEYVVFEYSHHADHDQQSVHRSVSVLRAFWEELCSPKP
jgi:sugar phosphate isomerase/epimerase